jgi:hypothetical protein
MKWTLAKLALSKTWPLLVLACVLALGGAATTGYIKGAGNAKAQCEIQALRAAAEFRAKQDAILSELEEVQREQRIIYRERVRTVQREPDPSGCADVAIPVGVRDALNAATR